MLLRALLLVMGVTAIAHADPAAEKLFQDGRTFLQQGKLTEACDAFRRSADIEKAVGTFVGLGECEERRGRIASAWEAFVNAKALATASGDARAARSEARAEALKKQLPYLTIKVPAERPTGFTIKRDGRDIASSQFDLELPIDPGRYSIEVSAPGHTTWTQEVPVVIGQKAVVAIPALAVDPNAKPTNGTTGTTGTTTNPIGVVTQPVDPAPKSGGKVAFGVAAGITTNGDFRGGLRIPIVLASVGSSGAIRVVPHIYYYNVVDIQGDDDHNQKILEFALGAEYVALVRPKFRVAAGGSFGIQAIDDSYDAEKRKLFGIVRLTPALRAGKNVDVFLNLGVYIMEETVSSGRPVRGLLELGVDYFF